MDTKLKVYLDKYFKELATKKDLKTLEKRIDDKTSDVLEVLRNVNENISNEVGKIDIAHSHLRQHVDHIFKRIEYLEKKILK